MPQAKIHCYFLDVEALEADFESWLSLLPSDRKEKCMRYMFMKDRLLSLGGGLLIEAYAGRGPYLFNKYGKPYKEGRPRFSLSHSGTRVLLAVSENEVGADIERIGDRDRKLVEYAFDEIERACIKSEADFFFAWCEKEALGKLLGFGIKDPKKTPVRPVAEGTVSFEGGQYHIAKGELSRYAYALACKNDFEFETIKVDLVKLKELLK